MANYRGDQKWLLSRAIRVPCAIRQKFDLLESFDVFGLESLFSDKQPFQFCIYTSVTPLIWFAPMI